MYVGHALDSPSSQSPDDRWIEYGKPCSKTHRFSARRPRKTLNLTTSTPTMMSSQTVTAAQPSPKFHGGSLFSTGKNVPVQPSREIGRASCRKGVLYTRVVAC